MASVHPCPAKLGHIGYRYNIGYSPSKSFDFFDDQLESASTEQVDFVEGIDNHRKEKGCAVTDERHRLSFYGESELSWRFPSMN